jgi:hypothetical protein
MNPFRNYPKRAPWCGTTGRCQTCGSTPDQVSVEFFAVVRGSWTSAEMDVLSKAARAALL